LSTSSTDAFLEVGRVVRPHGLRGQVVVELWSNRPERMAVGARLQAPDRELEVLHATPQRDVGGWRRSLVWFRGVESRDEAEALRGAVLTAPRLEDPDALWVHELIGSVVADRAGSVIGVVEAVQSNPASDLLVLTDGALIPLHFVVEQEAGRLTVDLPPGLLEL
jgi:16S rRNA processing protein RimM